MTLLLVFILYAIAFSAALALAGHRSHTGPPIEEARSKPVCILIVGATGGTGRQLVAQALERGYEVTALVRAVSKIQVEHPRLKIIQGNVLDYASVEAAVRGQDAVVSSLGHKRFFYPTWIQSEGTRNILQAMETHGVARFVCETSLGLGSSAGRLGLLFTLFTIPVILPHYFWDKTRQERVIASSKVEWIIVRPGVLTNGNKRGSYRHGADVGSFIMSVRISRADVADFMLDQLTSNKYLRTAPGVCW